MRKFVGWLIVSLVTSSVASAQDLPVTCSQADVSGMYSVEDWATLSNIGKVTACKWMELHKQPIPKTPLPTGPTTQPRSRGLVWAGLFTTVAGVLTAFPPGHTYTVLGDDYCVTDYAVDAGPCQRGPKATQIGGLMMAGGVTMMFIGAQRVSVSPQVSKTSVGASATISWGGERAK